MAGGLGGAKARQQRGSAFVAMLVVLGLVFASVPYSGYSLHGRSRMYVPPGSTMDVVRRTCPFIWVCSVGSACPVIFGVNLSVCSTNWSGYAVVGGRGSVSAVHGSWIVPMARCPSHGTRYSAFWVGIDGYNSSTVEQVGTDSDCVDGTPSYYAWYEFYPNASILIERVNVSVGDRIVASVAYDEATGNFTTFIGSSGGGSSSVSQAVPFASRMSAEWIVEAPKVCDDSGCTSAVLTGFGTAEFGSSGQDNATIGGRTERLGSLPDIAITLLLHCNSNTCTGPVLAEPALVRSDGSSFQVGRGGTFVSITCLPSKIVVGSPAACRATVEGPFATFGTVSWSTNGGGTFSKRSCKLVNGTCAVGYTPTSTGGTLSSGPVLVTASYGGDGFNLPSFGATDLSIAHKTSKTTVACAPSQGAGVAKTMRCIASVAGYRPTGTVAWSVGGAGQASLSASSCNLVHGRCSVTLTGARGGTTTVMAIYGGDRNNVGSQGTSSQTFA